MHLHPMLKTIGFVVIVVGVFSAVIPYVGRTFGYPMPPGSDQPAWQWTASHTQLHLLPSQPRHACAAR